MFQAVRNTFIAATAALAFGLFSAGAQAATVTLNDGDVINPVDVTTTYRYDTFLDGKDTAGSVSFDFVATPAQLPLSLGAITTNLAAFGADIKGFYMSLSDGVNTVFATFRVTPVGNGFFFDSSIEQAFSNPSGLTQTLTFGWDSYDATRGSLQLSIAVAAVPLPAGGLLLIGAIGGLAALRRRKALAA